MSHPQHKTLHSFKTRSQESINTAIHDLNAQIDRLGESILPKHPYILSVPSDVPYRHSSRFVNTWHLGTPFERREEQLQYMSFLPHQEEHEELLRVEGDWSDDRGQVLEEVPSPKTIYNSGRNTPSDQTQRKKISLKDYRTKDKMPSPSDASAAPAAPPANERPEEATTPAKQELKVEASNDREGEAKLPNAQRDDTSTATKPNLGGPSALDGPTSPVSPPTFTRDDSPSRPVKRRKLSPSLLPDTRLTREKDDTKQMPQLLSPTLPSPKMDNSLPELLSPVLPPTLIKAIATPPPSNGQERSHSHQRSDSVRSILANALGEPSPRPNEKNGGATASLGDSRVRSDSQHSARSNASGTNTHKVLAQVKSTAVTSKPGTPLLSATRSPGPRQRHTIALKYGKKNRKRVEALLKFAPRPKKAVPIKTESSEAAPKPEPKVQASAQEFSKLKRGLDRSSDPPAKSRPAHSPLEPSKRPTTPIHAKSKEPASTTSPSIPRSTYTTPKKELKSTAMRRVESGDGGDPSTPVDRGHESTPLGSDRTSILPKTSPAPSSVPSVRDEDRQVWSKMNQKYFQLGRTIKHEGSALAEKDAAKSIVLLIEALLCFMINLASQSCARPSADPGWRTILPYHIFVFRQSRRFSLLHGLVVQLGAVCRQLIHNYDMDRLGRDPLPDDHPGSAPTPGSDGNTKTNEDGEKYKRKYLDFRDELVQNARELQTAWLEGSRRLSPDLLERDLPKTWLGRLKDFRTRGVEKPTPGRMTTGYYLPLDPASTAFEAAQFALAVLEEWADAEDVDWKRRIEL